MNLLIQHKATILLEKRISSTSLIPDYNDNLKIDKKGYTVIDRVFIYEAGELDSVIIKLEPH